MNFTVKVAIVIGAPSTLHLDKVHRGKSVGNSVGKSIIKMTVICKGVLGS